MSAIRLLPSSRGRTAEESRVAHRSLSASRTAMCRPAQPDPLSACDPVSWWGEGHGAWRRYLSPSSSCDAGSAVYLAPPRPGGITLTGEFWCLQECCALPSRAHRGQEAIPTNLDRPSSRHRGNEERSRLTGWIHNETFKERCADDAEKYVEPEGVIHGVDCGCMSLGFLGWRRGG